MDINFKRSRAQVYLEKIIDSSYNAASASKSERKAFMGKVKNYSISSLDALKLEDELLLDADDYFYNGLISLIEGLNNIYEGAYSWGVIKLYYSLFYACRSYMAYKKICTFRATEVFRMDVMPNSTFTGGGNDYKNTHKAILTYFKSAFPMHYILSNEVDGNNALDWYEEVRNIINYKAARFYEPKCLEIIKKFEHNEKLIKIIQNLIEDSVGDVFIEDYAILGIPLKFFRLMIEELSLGMMAFEPDDFDYLFVLSQQKGINILDNLFSGKK